MVGPMYDEGSPAVLVVDRGGVIRRANYSARKLLGDCVGRPCLATVQPTDREGHQVCHRGCPRGRPDATVRWSSVGLRSNQAGSLCCTSMDGIVVVSMEGCHEQRPVSERLTPRECEVLTLVAEGLTTSVISAHLGVSDATVRTHVERS